MNVQRTKKLQNLGKGQVLGNSVRMTSKDILFPSLTTVAMTSKAVQQETMENASSSSSTPEPTFLLPQLFRKSKAGTRTNIVTPQEMLKTSSSSVGVNQTVAGTSSMVTPINQNIVNMTVGSSGYRNDTSTSTSGRRPQQMQRTPGQKTPGQKTPKSVGTTTSAEGSSCIVALTEGRGHARGEVGLAALDIQCPQLYLCQISDSHAYSKTLAKINTFNPIEIIFPNTLCEGPALSQLYKCVGKAFPNIMLSKIFRRNFNDVDGLQRIKSLCAPQFSSVELIISQKFYALSSAAALLKYVEYTHNIFFSAKSLKVEYQASQNTTLIDLETASRLEVVKSLCGTSPKHSLMGIMNHCQTKGGVRLLRANLLQPPCNRKVIQSRLECVQEILATPELFQALPKILAQFNEVDTLLSLSIHVPQEDNIRMAERQIRYLVLLKTTMELIPFLRNALQDCHSKFLSSAQEVLLDENFSEMLTKVLEVVSEDVRVSKGSALSHIQLNFALKHGINPWLDIGRKTYTELVNDMSELVAHLASKYKLPLKMSYSSSWGYHIQLPMGRPKVKQADLPPEFIQVHKLRNSFTFTTESLAAMDRRSKSAMENIQAINNSVICEVLEDIRKDIGCLYKLCDVIAELDMLMSFATVSCIPSYVLPKFNDFLRLQQARHPMLDYVAHTEPIPNDVFSSYHFNCQIITGPNMSGKSIYIRMIALLHIMAQVGCYIPAESATFRLTDRIFSRLSFNDSIECNASTFVLEISDRQFARIYPGNHVPGREPIHQLVKKLKEMKVILQNTTPRSLIILDELCRGTSSEEGTAVAWVILEDLLVNTEAYIFLTTHFLFLTNLKDMYPNVTNQHFEVLEAKTEKGRDHLIYTHRLLPGVTKTEHYGLHLIKTLPFPPMIIEKAYEFIEKIKSQRMANGTQGIFSNIISSTNREIYRLMADLKQQSDEGTLTADLCKDLQHKLRILMVCDESSSISEKDPTETVQPKENIDQTGDANILQEKNRDENNIDNTDDMQDETNLNQRQSGLEKLEDIQTPNNNATSIYEISNALEAHEPIEIIDLNAQVESVATGGDAAAVESEAVCSLQSQQDDVHIFSDAGKQFSNTFSPVNSQAESVGLASSSETRGMMNTRRLEVQRGKCHSWPYFGNLERDTHEVTVPNLVQTDTVSPLVKKLKTWNNKNVLHFHKESNAVIQRNEEPDDVMRSSNVSPISMRISENSNYNLQHFSANAEPFANFMTGANENACEYAYGTTNPLLIGIEEARKNMRLLFGSPEVIETVECANPKTEDNSHTEAASFEGGCFSIIQQAERSNPNMWNLCGSEQLEASSESDEENIIYPSPDFVYTGAISHKSV